jgi:hypothetical protein
MTNIPEPPPMDLEGHGLNYTECNLPPHGKRLTTEAVSKIEKILAQAESASTFIQLNRLQSEFFELMFYYSAHGYDTTSKEYGYLEKYQRAFK